jgi:hypothetical protein
VGIEDQPPVDGARGIDHAAEAAIGVGKVLHSTSLEVGEVGGPGVDAPADTPARGEVP